MGRVGLPIPSGPDTADATLLHPFVQGHGVAVEEGCRSTPLMDHAGGVSTALQYVHPKHPPDKEYCDDGSRDVNDPVASCFRFSKIEHARMVAGPAK